MDLIKSIAKRDNIDEVIFQADLPMCFVNTEGNFLRANTSMVELLGYTEYELKNMKFTDITHPADLDADLDLFRKTIAGEIDGYPMTKRYFTKEGNQVWARLIVTAIKDETKDGNNRVVCFFSQIIPIDHDNEASDVVNQMLLDKERRQKSVDKKASGGAVSIISKIIKNEWKWILAFGVTIVGGYITWETNRRVSDFREQERAKLIEKKIDANEKAIGDLVEGLDELNTKWDELMKILVERNDG